jgi:hypothetical protein
MKASLFAILCVIIPHSCNGFASWMENDMCEREIKLGEVIMNANVVYSKERHVRVFRDNVEIFPESSYVPNEILMVTLSDKTGDFIFTTNAGKFDPGGCDGLRSSRKTTSLVMPVDSEQVSIQAGNTILHTSYIRSLECKHEQPGPWTMEK